jgi:hypothetical protein
VGHFTVMQNEITAARPDLIGADGRISFAGTKNLIGYYKSYHINTIHRSIYLLVRDPHRQLQLEFCLE